MTRADRVPALLTGTGRAHVDGLADLSDMQRDLAGGDAVTAGMSARLRDARAERGRVMTARRAATGAAAVGSDRARRPEQARRRGRRTC